MSSDIEHFYVERGAPLSELLPDGAGWSHDGEEHVAEGGGWLLYVYDPEPVDPAEIPSDLRALMPGLSYRVDARLEPIDPPDQAWALLDAVLDTVGGARGGATYDPRSGLAFAWREGLRVR